MIKAKQPASVNSLPLWRMLILFILAIAVISSLHFLFSRPDFSPQEIATAETRMWQAYYSGERTEIGLQLISLLRNHHELNFLEAKRIGELFASSAMKFKKANGDYENIALEDLIKAYRLIKKGSSLSFEPTEAARAELAWWVARRTSGENSVEQVGAKIAELYEILYGSDHPSFITAGNLRAKAAKLRDQGGSNADWERIQSILEESYKELKTAI